MDLSELIAKYGDENVQFQLLDECTDTLNMNKKGITKVTFGTPQPFTPTGMEKMGLVLWLDRKRVGEILAEEATSPPPKPNSPAAALGRVK